MREYIGASDVANQVSMLRSVHRGAILVVEGATDKRLFGKLSDHRECEIIVAHSKSNVRLAVREVFFKRNDRKTLGIIDADLDRLMGDEPDPPIFLTDTRDAEMMLIASRSFKEVLWEYGEEELIERFIERHGSIRDAVVNAGHPIGLLMFVSRTRDLGLSFKDLDYSRFVDAHLSIDIRGMVEEVIYNSKNPSSNSKHIRNELIKEMDKGHDPWDVCRGHDAVGVLLIGLKKNFGSYNSRNLRCGELGGALRLAFDTSDFVGTELYRKTREWCDARGMKVWITEKGPL